MNKHIETKKGLKTLLSRYLKVKAPAEEIATIKGCLADGLAMDEVDFENTRKDLKKLWAGLK